MEKRVVLAVILCMGILFAWWKIFPPPTARQEAPPAVSPPASAAAAPSPAGAQAGGVPTPTPGAEGAPAGSPPPGPPAGAPRPPEQLVALDTPHARFELSSWGGTLRHARLKDPKYLARKGDPGSGLDVVRVDEPEAAPLSVAFPDSAFKLPADAAWKVENPAPDTAIFRLETPEVAIEKRFKADSTRYRLHLEVAVRNKTAKPQDHHLTLQVATRQDPNDKGGGFLSGASANMAEIICLAGDKPDRRTVDALRKEALAKVGPVRWVAAGEKFFMVAAAPYPENPPRERTCGGKALDEDRAQGHLGFAGRTVAPGESTSYAIAVVAGPKLLSDLDEVKPGGMDTGLGLAVDVNLAFISRPLLGLLKFFYGFSGNWGVAIILLTIFVKILTFYPMQRTLMSGKRMQRLGPKLAQIRKKYENDRARQGQEQMALYKAHGVSPLGGCLPSLITMPIWIALYSTLLYSVELYRSSFFGYLTDLTAKDPYYVTPLLMGVVMFAQMRMSPAGPDPAQQKMMAVMMPIMFTAFSLMLPSGLAIYMLTSYLIGIGQQLWVNRIDRKVHGPMPTVAS